MKIPLNSIVSIIFCFISTFTLADVTITPIATPSFGYVNVGPAGRDFYLKINSKMAGANSNDYLSGAQSGEYLIIGDGNTAEVTVQVTNISVSSGLTLTYIKCKYDGEKLKTCSNSPRVWPSPSLTGTRLRIGIRVVTAVEITTVSTESVSYDLEIVYN
jgi:hypothetical protein